MHEEADLFKQSVIHSQILLQLQLQSRLPPKSKEIPFSPFIIPILFNIYIAYLPNGLIYNGQLHEPFETLVICRNGDESSIASVLQYADYVARFRGPGAAVFDCVCL